MSVLIIAIGGILLYAAFGPYRFAVLTLVVGAFLLPRGVFVLAQGDGLNDISSPNLTLPTYSVAVIASLVGLVIAGERLRVPGSLMIGVFALIGMQLIVWDPEVRVVSGTVSLVVGVMAWPIGVAVGQRCFVDVSLLRFVARAVALIMIVELAIELLQLRGVSLPHFLTSSGRLEIDVDSRVYGTLGHPANTSKIILLGLFILLICVASKDSRTRVWAYVGAAAALPAAALTISRANTIAIAILMTCWVIAASRGLARALRQVLFVLIIVSGIGFYAAFADRFSADPNGGARPELLHAGLNQIAQAPFSGVGPNNYINVVGRVDASTALGYPVHNTALLLAASVGIPIAFLLLLPQGRLVLRGIRGFRTSNAARVVVFGLPGMLLVTMTGWALGSQYLLVAWYFVGGFLWATIGGELERENTSSRQSEPLDQPVRALSPMPHLLRR